MSRSDAGTEFRGVCWRPGGKFGARIRESKGKPQTWLGTFDTAEHAARAFDAAAVRMHGAAARTNFKLPAAVDDDGVSSASLLHVPAEPSGHDARTKFRGVCRQPGGKFGARIRGSKGNNQRWLGTFDTAKEAARAFDAAAVKIRGAAARTNFKQPAAIDDDGVSSLLAELSGQCVHRQQSSGEYTAAEWHQVEELLKGMDSSDDREKLIEAAAILQHISLAGHGDGWR